MSVIKSLLKLAVKAFAFLILIGIVVIAPLVYGATKEPLIELASPSSLSGKDTSAKFFAGATADNGASYVNSFAYEQAIDVLTEIQIETSHINSVGNLYVLIAWGEEIFMLLESGEYVPWDSALESLQAARANKILQAKEALTIIDDLAFGPIGIADTTLTIYLAYKTLSGPNELYFSGAPLSFFISSEGGESESLTFYRENIATPIIQGRCIVCHQEGGMAENSALTYVDSQTLDYQSINYNSLLDFIKKETNGASLLLTKPQGQAHGGGTQLFSGNGNLELWSNFVDSMLADFMFHGSSSDDQNIFRDIVRARNEKTLRKASLLFAGRLPTEVELNIVADSGDEELREVIRSLMDGDGFHDFLIESANDQLLTEAFSNRLFAVVNRYRYPNSMRYYNNSSVRSDRLLASEAIAQEPLRLIAHVVTNERPYTEILTADYIMVNPYSAQIYGGDVSFNNYDDSNEWREGRITAYYRCTVCNQNNPDVSYEIETDYPHAGILNSPAFLARFPSTATNRNRARARWAYYFFLGVDIEALSERTTDQEALADENNPTLNNPNCVVCHDIMDPVAGAFQNYGDGGFYRDKANGSNSLPYSYKVDPLSLYQVGDTWYNDMLAPGFGDLLAPNPNNSLQWLAHEFVKDSRFGYGTVNFWYSAVIGRDPYTKPANPQDPNYKSNLAAYTTEQELMHQIADDFVLGLSGNGAYNLKDMLVSLVMSYHFRAESVKELNPAQQVELNEIGIGRLLSPEQLNRKLLDVSGYYWRYGAANVLEQVYNLVYGGIDSVGITDRATELTALMSTVVAAMANETSCPIVSNDFSKPQSERNLFTAVELNSTPISDPAAIRANIQLLHERLWGESIPINHPEIDATFKLFDSIWSARIRAGKSPSVSGASELCVFEPWKNSIRRDPNQTLRSWAAVINYMLRDYKFIHE